MNAFWKDPSRRELVVAAAAGAVWALLGVALAAHGSEPSSCRIHNYLDSGAANVGSGTLIDVTADRRRGLVLTCAHLFTEGCGRVIVAMSDGRTHGANVVGLNREADLAALEIADPLVEPAPVALEVNAAVPLTACGFGGDGRFRCIVGRVIGVTQSPGQVSLRMSGAVRSGDSGGGVFDQQGRLVAVVWGEAEGVTYASTGGPLRGFLQRVLGRRVEAQPTQPLICPDGQCPLVSPMPIDGAPAGRRPAAGGELFGDELAIEGECDCGCGEQLDELEGRVEGLAPLLGAAGRAAGPLAVSALGISGPAGWAVLAGASLVSVLIGRRMKRRLRVSSSELREEKSKLATRNPLLATSPEATAAADRSFRIETRQPIERDDREARELLRLSQLEGRDPLQDALAGRLALDRLDEVADGDDDPQRAAWADALRRELRDRFNDVAPTKFQIKA